MPDLRLRNADIAWMKYLIKYPAITTQDSYRLLAYLGYKRHPLYHTTRTRDLSGAVENAPVPEARHKNRHLRRQGFILTWSPYNGPAYASEDGKPYRKRPIMHSLTSYGAMLMTGDPDFEAPRNDSRDAHRNHYQTAFLIDLLEAGVPAGVIAPAIRLKLELSLHVRTPMALTLSINNSFDIFCIALVVNNREYSTGWGGYIEFAKPSARRQVYGGGTAKYLIVTPWSLYAQAIGCIFDRAYETYILPYEYAAQTLACLREEPACYIRELAGLLKAESYSECASGSPFRYKAVLPGGREVYLCEFVSGDLRTLLELYNYTRTHEIYCLVRPKQLDILKDLGHDIPMLFRAANINFKFA